MNNRARTEFSTIIKGLRDAARLKQREVAAVLGVQGGTYGNMESSPFRLVRRERVDALSRFYKLDVTQHAELIAAYEKLPLSEYSQRQKETWTKRNAMRSKGKRLDEVTLVLCDLLDGIASAGQHGYAFPVQCACKPPDDFVGEDGYTCDLCRAFHTLGFPDGYVSPEVALERIEKISPIAPGQRPVIRNTPHIPKVTP